MQNALTPSDAGLLNPDPLHNITLGPFALTQGFDDLEPQGIGKEAKKGKTVTHVNIHDRESC